MDTGTGARHRANAFRRVGWLTIAAMTTLALVGPATGPALATATYATVSGYAEGSSDNNQEETWGDNCTKIEPGGSTYVLSQGYTKVIVKAGSDQSTDGHTNTIFDNPLGGQTVWADSNGSGAFDEGDKEISHIILCGSTSTTTSSTTTSSTTEACVDVSFTATINAVEHALPAHLGRYTYPLLTVTVTADDGVPEGCEQSWSLNSYATDGPTWETSGTQVLFDHDSITLDSENPSDTLTVIAPRCYGQTDFYEGVTRFDGVDGPLPHYPDSVVPNPGLIAYSNGGTACTTTTTTSSTTTTGTTTTGTTTTGTTTTGTTTTGTTTTGTTTTGTTTTGTTTTGTTTTGTTTTGTTTTGTTTTGTTTTGTTTTGTTTTGTTTTDTTTHRHDHAGDDHAGDDDRHDERRRRRPRRDRDPEPHAAADRHPADRRHPRRRQLAARPPRDRRSVDDDPASHAGHPRAGSPPQVAVHRSPSPRRRQKPGPSGPGFPFCTGCQWPAARFRWAPGLPRSRLLGAGRQQLTTSKSETCTPRHREIPVGRAKSTRRVPADGPSSPLVDRSAA